jgi:hypothetical protein
MSVEDIGQVQPMFTHARLSPLWVARPSELRLIVERVAVARTLASGGM